MKVKLPLILLATLILVACNQQKPLPEEPIKEVKILYKAEKFDDALSLINRIIEDKGETEDLISWKIQLFKKLKRYEEALALSHEEEKKFNKKSAWHAISFTDLNLQLNRDEKAFEWFKIAVERGFNSLDMLEEEPFIRLSKIEGYKSLEQTILEKLGLNKPVKDFILKNLEGKEIQLSKLKGNVVVLDFWATWCPPCRASIPSLVKIQKKFENKKFKLIGISLDKKNNLDGLKKFVKENNMTWDIAYSGKGWKDETSNLYGVKSIPSVWVIDKKGILRGFGLHDKKLEEKITELLK